MDIKKFQFIEGSIATGEVATIRFFDSVDAWSVSSFVDEFHWLENYVKPSKIKILINSEGGSVLRGMGAFSAIINSEVPTETIVEGLAASMGSVLLAAGGVAKMRDYGIIMLHNPFGGNDPNDPMVLAFKDQLKVIYKKRWGFSDERITEIMDGPEDADGTYMNAEAAVEYGIMHQDNVIQTPLQDKESILAKLDTSNSTVNYGEVFSCSCPVNSNIKPSLDNLSNIKSEGNTVPNDNNNNQQNSNTMENNFEAVVATLELAKNSTPADVMAKIVALNKVEAKVAALTQDNATLTQDNADLVIAKTGLQTSLETVTGQLTDKETELTSVKAELQAFQDEKIAKVKAEQEAVIDDAIKAGKIKAESKDQWVSMANMNFDTVKSTLDSMPGKTVISQEIVADAGSTFVSEGGVQLTDEEVKAKEHADKIKAVVGDITYTKLA